MEDDELFAAYFKKDAEYYLNKLERYKSGEKYVFNVYAFFCGIFWFMYRKMYREAFLIIIVIVAEGYLKSLLTTQMSETVVNLVSRLTTLLVGITVAMLANALYIRKAESVITKAQQEIADPESLVSYLEKKGGVSYWFLISLLVIAAGIIWYFYRLNNEG